jgi:FeS assembly protein IscX
MAAKEFTWDDEEKIGIALSQKHPKVEPTSVALRDVHNYVTALAEFKGDAADFNERKLEAIRKAWITEFLDRTQ